MDRRKGSGWGQGQMEKGIKTRVNTPVRTQMDGPMAEWVGKTQMMNTWRNQ